MLDFLKPKKRPSTAEQAVEKRRQEIADLAKVPMPEITEEMRQELRTIIGEASLRKNPGLNPNNLREYYANTRPTYALGMIQFETDHGPKTWENAWSAMLEQIASMKQDGII
jgi:hypothetical protein